MRLGSFKIAIPSLFSFLPQSFSRAIYLTNIIVKFAQNTEVNKLVWIASSAATSSGLEQGLSKAAKIAQNSSLDTLILRHAPIFSDLLNFKHEIKFRRTLSLPLASNSLPWIAPEDIAIGVYQWISGINNTEFSGVLTGKEQVER